MEIFPFADKQSGFRNSDARTEKVPNVKSVT